MRVASSAAFRLTSHGSSCLEVVQSLKEKLVGIQNIVHNSTSVDHGGSDVLAELWDSCGHDHSHWHAANITRQKFESLWAEYISVEAQLIHALDVASLLSNALEETSPESNVSIIFPLHSTTRLIQ